MENRVSVVIGANYGDEGKGLITDYLASKDPHNTVVARFNGGAQAGHTVVTPDGRRHVFHHFGSGTLAGAATYFSKHFIMNPISFTTELKALLDLGVDPSAWFDGQARITTPWDMMVNQAIERKRGVRHGSCGMGIHETVVRSRFTSLLVTDLFAHDKKWWRKRLLEIRDEYLPERLASLDLSLADLPFYGAANRLSPKGDDDGLLKHFMDDLAFLRRILAMRALEIEELSRWDHVVFEGAQGLRLDEGAKDFPHVTCSKTGLANVLEILSYAGFPDTFDAYYVTRPYITRHGNGPLPHSDKPFPFGEIIDPTNKPNDWQGTMRFALMDADEMVEVIKKDISMGMAYEDCAFHVLMAFTCVDHIMVGVPYQWIKEGQVVETTFSEFCTYVREKVGTTRPADTLYSTGPTRNDVSGR